MTEYRVSTHTGNIFTQEEFFSLYRDQYSIQDHKTISALWNELTPLPIEEGTDIKELQAKMRFIYRNPSSYSGSSDTLYIKDPTKLLRLVPRAPRKDGL